MADAVVGIGLERDGGGGHVVVAGEARLNAVAHCQSDMEMVIA